jgi:rSAM/selenodomain-associated transferase 1
MVDVAHTDVVAVLTRAPSAGGKSRLFASLRRPADPALLEALLLDTIEGATCPGACLVLSVTPDSAVHTFRGTGIQAMSQPEGDLGARMGGTMKYLLDAGARRVAVIGADLPAMTCLRLRAAFEALDRDPAAVVLGPAADGGYYLIASTSVPPVFDGIAWGTADVLAQTRAAAMLAGLPVVLLDPMRDVDTVDDLRHLPASASRTIAWARANGVL